MKCEKCGAELQQKDDKLVCPNCGAEVDLTTPESAINEQTLAISQFDTEAASEYITPRGFSSKKNIIIIILAAILVLGLGAGITAIAVTNSPSFRVSQGIDLAERYLSEQNYEQAIIEYEKVLEIEPMNVDAYLGLAKAYEKMGDYDKAFEILEEGIEKTDDKSLKKRLERVQDENITSANSTAYTLRTQITTFLVNADYYMKETLNGPSTATMYTITVSDGKWTMRATTPPNFGDGSKVIWGAKTPADPSTSFIDYMTENEELRDLKDAYIEMYLQWGTCVGVAVRQGTLTAATGIAVDDWKVGKTAAFPDKPGIDANGQIIGTNPQLDKAD